MAERLLWSAPLGIASTAVTSTTFVGIAGFEGVLIDSELLRALTPRPSVRLAVIMMVDTTGPLSVRLVVVRPDQSVIVLPESTLTTTALTWGMQQSISIPLVLFMTQPVFALRLQARVNAGTGTIAMPTLHFLR